MRDAACWAYAPSTPGHATIARLGNLSLVAAIASLTDLTNSDSPFKRTRWRALVIPKIVLKRSRVASSCFSPTAFVTRERMLRSLAGSEILVPSFFLAKATSSIFSMRSRKSSAILSSITSISRRSSAMSFITIQISFSYQLATRPLTAETFFIVSVNIAGV